MAASRAVIVSTTRFDRGNREIAKMMPKNGRGCILVVLEILIGGAILLALVSTGIFNR